jgi:2-octaprenylphenol hydroxylase
MTAYDVVIVGSGVVGATTALALAKNTQLRIAILDANEIQFDWNENVCDHRVSAISLASKNIFKNLQVWDVIASKRISSYTAMHVWDEKNASEIHFDCKEVGESALGYIIEDNVVRISLVSALKQYPHVDFIFPKKLISFCETVEGLKLELDGAQIITKLLIAADGANSRVRELMDSQLKEYDYGHTAIVATLQTEFSNQATAWQRFLKTGPLAFLPLQEKHTSSIVWSASHDYAKELLAMNDARFCEQLEKSFYKLGRIDSVGTRYHFPLRMRHVKHYVQSRVALIGDAAHTIHPLLGQGVNLGLLDAACLVEVLLDSIKKHRDFSGFSVLRRYERWRKSDNLAMLTSAEMFKKMFATDNAMLEQMRNVGMNFTNHTAIIKNFFTNYALGKRGDLPSLAK